MEVGMEQLQRVDRVQALESLMAYKTLADDIKNYFETFKNTGKIVTKQDIDAFFAVSKTPVESFHYYNFTHPINCRLKDKSDRNVNNKCFKIKGWLYFDRYKLQLY
jgi:hypothetical protein